MHYYEGCWHMINLQTPSVIQTGLPGAHFVLFSSFQRELIITDQRRRRIELEIKPLDSYVKKMDITALHIKMSSFIAHKQDCIAYLTQVRLFQRFWRYRFWEICPLATCLTIHPTRVRLGGTWTSAISSLREGPEKAATHSRVRRDRHAHSQWMRP